jgi:hypothetical protein
MAYIKFARNQSNEADNMLLNIDNIVTMNASAISSSSATLTVKTGNVVLQDATNPEIIAYALTVSVVDDMTREGIVQSVIDAIEKSGFDGGAAVKVAGLTVTGVSITGDTL